jgi:hypothetical protein
VLEKIVRILVLRVGQVFSVGKMQRLDAEAVLKITGAGELKILAEFGLEPFIETLIACRSDVVGEM